MEFMFRLYLSGYDLQHWIGFQRYQAVRCNQKALYQLTHVSSGVVMEDFLSSLISSGPVGIVSAAVVYIIIHLQRSKTGKKRDESEVLLNYRVDQLEKSHGDLASNIKELQEAIIQLQLSINRLIGKIEK